MRPTAGLFHQEVLAGLQRAAGVGRVLALGAAYDDSEHRGVVQKPVDVVEIWNASRVGFGLVGGACFGARLKNASQVDFREIPQPAQLARGVAVLRTEHTKTYGLLAHDGRSFVEFGRTMSGICTSAGRTSRRKKCPSPADPSMKSGL